MNREQKRVSLEDGEASDPTELLDERPLIETPVAVRLQVVDGLRQLVEKIAETIPSREQQAQTGEQPVSPPQVPLTAGADGNEFLFRPRPIRRRQPEIAPMRAAQLVPFEVFWVRVKNELTKAERATSGKYVLPVQKWSQHSGEMSGGFTLIYRGGDTFICDTASTEGLRQISSAEVRKVYEVWRDYRAGQQGRSHIAHELGVQNTTWIIPLLRRFEDLMF